jgi:hypothetical protein
VKAAGLPLTRTYKFEGRVKAVEDKWTKFQDRWTRKNLVTIEVVCDPIETTVPFGKCGLEVDKQHE